MHPIVLEKLAGTSFICIGAKKTSRHHAGMSIHARIKQKREALGLSMEKLAELVGVKSWQTVQQWEKEDGTAPKRDRLKTVADALGVTPEWLLFGSDQSQIGQMPGAFKIDTTKYRSISVFGRAMGGFPERIFDDDGGWPPGFSDVYAEVASSDKNAFLVPVEGESMVPRYNPGEFALVEPNTDPEIEDDVLVRFEDGRTMIKKLLSRRGVTRLGSYNSAEVISAPPEKVVWMYYVAHPVPARKIKQRF
jgi:phage repressor protein C with HTH and peptisase S24 domain